MNSEDKRYSRALQLEGESWRNDDVVTLSRPLSRGGDGKGAPLRASTTTIVAHRAASPLPQLRVARPAALQRGGEGDPEHVLKGHGWNVLSVSWHPEKALLASGTWPYASEPVSP